MTVVRGFTITILSGVVFGLTGGLIGFCLGTFAPDYYRVVFRIPPSMDIDPAHAGLGLGITQGLAAGLFIGLVIVVCASWYESRKGNDSG